MTLNEFWQKCKSIAVKFGKKAWEYIKLAKLELIVLVALFVLDLVSKAIIEATMDVGQTVTLIPKFLQFTFCYNDMAAFGSAFGLEKIIKPEAIRVIFIIITFIAIGLFSYFMYRNRGKNKLERIALGMIIAGAAGNLVDRLFIGQVRDFVEIVYFGCNIPWAGGTSFAIFNVADASLVIGVILFLIYIIFLNKAEPEEAAAAPTTDTAPTESTVQTEDNAAAQTEEQQNEKPAAEEPNTEAPSDAQPSIEEPHGEQPHDEEKA